MKTIREKFLYSFLVFFAISCPLLPAAASDFSSAANGTTGAQFLNLGVGARAAAMGGAFNAVADDATALYWNPAALTNMTGTSIAAMHAPYIASSYFDYLAIGHTFSDYGSAAVSYQFFSLGGVPATDASGGSLGTVSPYDLAVTVGYACAPDFLNGYSVGLAGKFIKATTSLESADTEALDFGLLSPGYMNNQLHWAFTIDNVGKPLSYDGDSEPLPLAYNLGGAWQISSKWLATGNLSAPRGGNPYFEAGTEYRIFHDEIWNFLGRAGYDSQTLQSITGFTGFSFGFGVGFRKLSVDYAFTAFGGLGLANRVSISYRL